MQDAQKQHAANALANLAVNDDNKIAIAKAGGIPPLVALIRDGNDTQKKHAAGALANFGAAARRAAGDRHRLPGDLLRRHGAARQRRQDRRLLRRLRRRRAGRGSPNQVATVWTCEREARR